MTIRDTLLLDRGYQPLKVIPWQRALVLDLVGKVETVTTHEWSVHTIDRQFPVPAVVRLLRPIRHRPPFVRFSRENVYLRDGYQCQYCGDHLPARDLTLDHVVPRCEGGVTSWTNVVAACGPCNRRKGRDLPDEAGMPLLSTPRRPRWLAPRILGLSDAQMPVTWRDWLH
ncbi:MAG: HNH endonuclease [Myxococcales bacterium]|nr:HNH endonuclease [Myxococcales bacterium]MCB9714991.1 HNH endonuclease [Myxococcales bacterium]